MRFFLDENFPKSCGDILIKLGHQVFDIRGSNKEGSDDNTIFSLAQKNNSIFLTTDKDFFHTIPYKFQSHKGVIVFCFNQPNKNIIMEKMEWVLNNLTLDNFDSKILLLRDNNYLIVETDK